MTRETFAGIQPTLPAAPGVYRYYGADGQILYVGKAKNIRKRVSSYFVRQTDYYKTVRLVEEIARIEYTVTGSEQDAFLLENSLIKEFKPKFNIELKDDKTYPYIVIKREPFPRVFLTRRLIRDGSEYLGPYTSIDQVRSLLELLRQTLPLRTCKLNLSERNIHSGKFKPCLEYHIGNCKAPCAGLQTREEYDWQVQQVREILKGKLGGITKYYKQEMLRLAENMEFEQAELVKKKLEYIAGYQSRSVVVNPRIQELDICSIVSDHEAAYVNYMMVVHGSIVQSHSTRIEKKIEESDEDILPEALQLLRERFRSQASEVVLPFAVPVEENLQVSVPKAGDKLKLLELSLQNANARMQEQARKASLMLKEESDEERRALLQDLQKALGLPARPVHIECFDNSNFQGSFPVAAMVCFRDGLPDKKNYRHFHIKTVQGINDFASMKEIVYRRYKRLKEESIPLPQLIIIDGGKGQLGAAMEAIRALDLQGRTTLVGLAKNVEEVFFPGDQESVKLPYQSPTLNLMKRIRDEVHRFGITFHRQTRSKGTIKNELENIPGIGAKTATELLKVFRSVKRLREADLADIAAVTGKAKAEMLKHWFDEQQTEVPGIKSKSSD